MCVVLMVSLYVQLGALSLGSIEERLLNGSRGTATSYLEDNGGSTQAYIIDTWKTRHRYTTKLIG